MLFISYWELNPDFDPSELADIAQKLMSKKLYPVEGVKQLGFYISATDFWGISIDEAENVEQMAKGINIWRLAKPGYLKLVKTTPAMEVIQMVPLLMKLKKQLD